MTMTEGTLQQSLDNLKYATGQAVTKQPTDNTEVIDGVVYVKVRFNDLAALTEAMPATGLPDIAATTDAAALNNIASALGLYTTDPGNNPVAEVLNGIIDQVKGTGRRTDVPEGA